MAFRPPRRYTQIPHAPYYDTESFNTYLEMMAQAQDDEDRKAIEESLRQVAMEQSDRIGSATRDPDMKAYNLWAGYDINDPNRPELPPMHSGPVRADKGGDYRTDEYLQQAAQDTKRVGRKLVGPSAGLRDRRTRENLELYGPGGPLNKNTPEAGLDPQIRQQLLEAQTGPQFADLIRMGIGGDLLAERQNPQYFAAIEKWRELKKKMGSKPFRLGAGITHRKAGR